MPLIGRQLQTLEEGFAYIESFTNFERTNRATIRSYRLDRMRALLDLFDNPQKAVKIIHIAGTKGKGSTGIYIASILSEAHHPTGLYTSPHVSSYTERITLAGTPFGSSLYLAMINAVASRLSASHFSPTTFELLTLLGFLIFRESGCKWAVVETGIGGRLDATNVVSPEACVLTPVEREHTDILGDTLVQIAGEKAGIIKPGVPAFSGYQHPDVRAVFEQRAAAVGAPISFLADELPATESRLRPNGSDITLRWRARETERFELGMLGEVQADNAALAVMTLRSIPEVAWPVPAPDAVRRGLRRARLPGRMELFSVAPSLAPPLPRPAAGRGTGAAKSFPASRQGRSVPILLDAAHTPVSVARLLGSFGRLFPGEALLIFGSVLGKDPERMAQVLAPHFRKIFISTPGSFKKSDPADVHRHFAEWNPGTQLVPEPGAALRNALDAATADPGKGPLPILVTGSFYMVAEIRAFLIDRPATPD